MTDTTIVARRIVRADEPQFAGHYPGNPIMPGVLLTETVVQAGAYLVATKFGIDSETAGTPVLARLGTVKFKNIVRPGDELRIFSEYLKSKAGAHMLKGHIEVGDKMACSLEYTVMHVAEDKA